MNILLVSGPGISLKEPYNSGIESFMVSFANKLVEEGHNVDVVALEADANCKFRVLNPFRVFKRTPPFFKRLQELRQFKNLDVSHYDVIHYNMFYPHLLKAGLTFNKPLFLTLHSPADKKRILAYKKLSRQGDITFAAISERVRLQWEQALAKQIPLIHNGIDLTLWPTKKHSGSGYLLWSARINKEKNVADAIRLAKHMQLPLRIAGRIVDQDYFDSEVKPFLNDQIQYAGHLTRRELSSLAKQAAVFLATATWQEPFGLAALEMLSSGVPVVGYQTAVPPDWTDQSVMTTRSHRWQDLEKLVVKSNSITPADCKNFASTFGIHQMTLNYLQLYSQKAAKDKNSLGTSNVRKVMSHESEIANKDY
ncbi:MAG: glycosyltransferase [Flavitalea sp.]